MSAADTSSTFWYKFFQAAGIPNSDSKNYAVIFTEHRIKKDMLLDLNKDLLNSLGVTVIGDVISIIRQAKKTHNECVRETVADEVKTTSVKKIVKKSVANKNQVTNKVKDTNTVSLTDRLGDTKNEVKEKPRVVRLLPHKKDLDDVPKKIRKVDPIEEGGYTIIKPKGITPLTKQILEKEKSKVQTSIDDETLTRCVHSVKNSVSDNFPKVTITGIHNDNNFSNANDSSSVFGRLGNRSGINTVQFEKRNVKTESPTLQSDRFSVSEPIKKRLGIKPIIAPASSTTPTARILKRNASLNLSEYSNNIGSLSGITKTITVKQRLGDHNVKTGPGVFSRLG